MPEIAPGTSRSTIVLALGAVWVLWGSVYLGIRLVVNEVDPLQAMAQRFAAAGLILVAVVVAVRGWRALKVSRAQLGALVLTGTLLLGLGNGLQALGQVEGLPSGVAALVVACVPAWAVLIRAVTGDRPSAATVCGVVVGFGGLVVLVVLGRGGGDAMPVAGVLLCVAASLCWTLGSYLQGVLRTPRDVLVVAAYQQLVAACCSAALAGARGEEFSIDYSTRGWLAMAHLVLLCSIAGFVAFAWLATHVPLSLTATHAYVNPVVAVLLGWLVLAEPISVAVLAGGSIVVVAVALIVSAERGPRGRAGGPPTDVAAPVDAVLTVAPPHRGGENLPK